MKIIVVDDEPKALRSFLRVLQEVEPNAGTVSFTDVEDAFTYLSHNIVDIAFLDIKMGGMNGLTLAEKCKCLCPMVNIIFVTGYSKYTMDALRLHVSGYLMKPVRSEDLRTELENLRFPLPSFHNRVRIQTFGNFEIYVDGKALRVPRKKCKECLAYLVDRKGAGVAFSQISSVLWEGTPMDRPMQKNTQKIISDLGKALKAVNAQDILIRTRVDIAVDMEKVDCDYFRVLNGEMEWMNSFSGEYMSNYSWAEPTLGTLVEIKHKNTEKVLR